MKQWNGLLRKEWVQWRWTLLVLAILLVTELFVLPIFFRNACGGNLSVFEITMVVCFVTAAFGIFVPVIFSQSCSIRDMKRARVVVAFNGFHNDAFWSENDYGTLIGAGSLLIPTAVVAIRYAFTRDSVAYV